jgi:hypothetical protein
MDDVDIPGNPAGLDQGVQSHPAGDVAGSQHDSVGRD